jgi:hypothetical protein
MWYGWGTEEVHREFWWKNPIKNISLGKRRCRWEDNIKMCFQEVRWGEWNILQWRGLA